MMIHASSDDSLRASFFPSKFSSLAINQINAKTAKSLLPLKSISMKSNKKKK